MNVVYLHENCGGEEAYRVAGDGSAFCPRCGEDEPVFIRVKEDYEDVYKDKFNGVCLITYREELKDKWMYTYRESGFPGFDLQINARFSPSVCWREAVKHIGNDPMLCPVDRHYEKGL